MNTKGVIKWYASTHLIEYVSRANGMNFQFHIPGVIQNIFKVYFYKLELLFDPLKYFNQQFPLHIFFWQYLLKLSVRNFVLSQQTQGREVSLYFDIINITWVILQKPHVNLRCVNRINNHKKLGCILYFLKSSLTLIGNCQDGLSTSP